MPKAKTKKSREDIIDLSMAYLADKGFDVSIAQLCKSKKIAQSQFKSEFESIENFEKFVWCELMRSSIETANSDTQFATFSNREKLLTLYFTFFDNCGLNSEFLKQSIKHHGRPGMIKVLKMLKQEFSSFVNFNLKFSLPLENQYAAQFNSMSNVAIGEAFYGQLLFLLDFWSKDSSLEFEKTDMAIEKTVKASMDIINVTPVKSVIDLAKFFWKERVQKTV